jgi:hypothetical protein
MNFVNAIEAKIEKEIERCEFSQSIGRVKAIKPYIDPSCWALLHSTQPTDIKRNIKRLAFLT